MRELDRSRDESTVCLGQAQVLGAPRVNQRIDQHRIELSQPCEQDCQRPVVVRIPRGPAAQASAAAFHDQSEVTAIRFDKILSVQDPAMVIYQMHESQTPSECGLCRPGASRPGGRRDRLTPSAGCHWSAVQRPWQNLC